MSFIWNCSSRLKREDFINDENLIMKNAKEGIREDLKIISKDGEEYDYRSLEEEVELKNGKGKAGFTYFYSKDDDGWILDMIGSHSDAVPVLKYMNQKYGENYMELDDDYIYNFNRNFEFDEEEGPSESMEKDINLFIELWRMSYMDMYGLLGDNDPFTLKMKSLDREELSEWLERITDPGIILIGINNVILGGERKEYIC